MTPEIFDQTYVNTKRNLLFVSTLAISHSFGIIYIPAAPVLRDIIDKPQYFEWGLFLMTFYLFTNFILRKNVLFSKNGLEDKFNIPDTKKRNIILSFIDSLQFSMERNYTDQHTAPYLLNLKTDVETYMTYIDFIITDINENSSQETKKRKWSVFLHSIANEARDETTLKLIEEIANNIAIGNESFLNNGSFKNTKYLLQSHQSLIKSLANIEKETELYLDRLQKVDHIDITLPALISIFALGSILWKIL